MLRRLPIDSTGPMQLFAATRVAAALIALIAIVALGLSDDTQEALVIGGLALPWTVAVLVVARRRPDFALSPVVPAVAPSSRHACQPTLCSQRDWDTPATPIRWRRSSAMP